ncbi:glycosyltransferase family 69 protein [Macroventuria anomochaeta]|uniref:Glycosyltransferase family 69 protein n=1 Tax=Macroventuria anomochaeta TaxID=301207 RepID=A0ACB6SCJ0_9PLEO|nr:glycosyltransferase family 69 protein [Macroventuria anomochaeta]KAF2631871.1 glycosyltransferase family 69 protein [Macroventuria anomochaeta]
MMRNLRVLRRRPIKQVLILVFILFNIFEVAQILRCLSSPTNEPVTQRSERVYIASIHWNNERILRSHWNDAVIALANALGRENVFVTVYESGSWDDSKGALRELDMALAAHKIRRNITLSETTHLDEISVVNRGSGWIDTPRGRRELRRIPYLSRLRNWTLEPLQELARQGERFDKVLFLNDVVFNTDDIFRLLNTNDGDFAAACSLDFSQPPQFYDTFALRDAEGHERLMQTWPYFRARESRRAMLRNRPVPVTSCWNGIVAMPAGPFVSSPSLQFRGIPDSLAASHVEGSECCLIHIDNPLRVEKRTYVNPQVRVGYSGEAYDAVHPQGLLLSSWQVFKALWENRIRRWMTSPWLKEGEVSRRVKRWKSMSRENEEAGEICLINEMQVLVENGWAHV